MARKPFISVVVATYNRAPVLTECLDSFSAQTYSKDLFEVIVINDGSKDNTKDLIDSYSKTADYTLKVLTQENRGISAARNAGIFLADGEIILITDDDCVLDKNCIDKISEGFDNVIVGGVGGAIISYWSSSLIDRYSEDRGLLNQAKFKSKNFLVTSNAAFRKEVLSKMNGFDMLLPSCVDMDVSIQTQLLGYELRYVPEAIIYHKHRSSLRGLIRQQDRAGKGFSRLNKKYTQDFKPAYCLAIYSFKLAATLLAYPLTLISIVFRGDDRTYLASRPILDMIVLISFAKGLLIESVFGGKYTGNKFEKKLNFVEDTSFTALFAKALKKLSP